MDQKTSFNTSDSNKIQTVVTSKINQCEKKEIKKKNSQITKLHQIL